MDDQVMQVQPSLTEDRVVVKAGDAVITVSWDEWGVLCVGVLENEEPNIRVYPSEHATAVVRSNGVWQ
jgi:hypothetical protein